MKNSKMNLLNVCTGRIEIKPIGVSIANGILTIMFNMGDDEEQLKINLRNDNNAIFFRKVQMAKKIAIKQEEESNESCKYFYQNEKDLMPCTVEIIE